MAARCNAKFFVNADGIDAVWQDQGITMARVFPKMLTLALLCAGAAPALAHDPVADVPQPGYQGGYPGPYQGGYQGGVPVPHGGWPQGPSHALPQGAAPYSPQEDARYRDMVERCRKYARPDNGLGGTLIGGAVGGVIGNRVASGNRTLGTIVGGAIGALTGRAIDKGEDKGRERECAEFFRSYAPQGSYGGGYPAGYGTPGYGHPAYGYMMVPVYFVQSPQKPYTETKTTTVEYVTDTHTRHRYIPRHPVYRYKRVKDKRVHMGS